MANADGRDRTVRVPTVCPVLVGREPELQALQEALGAVRGGPGEVVVVTGEAGIGKSRLVHELADMARRQGVPVAEGRAVPTGDTEPYRPITEALLEILRDRPFPDSSELTPWLPALDGLLPNVGRDLSPSDGAPSVTARGEAVLLLLRLVARSDAQVIVLEDLHWADADTLPLFEYLADNAADGSVLWVVTCRDEQPGQAVDTVRRLHNRGHALHLRLRSLDDAHVTEMVAACDPQADSGTVDRVREATDGIPLLVEEVLASPGVPATVADTVRVRLDELSEDERLVLSAASVIGARFDWRVLPATTGLSLDAVSRALERGIEALILTVDGDRFRFRHALTREAISSTLLPPRRASLAAAALDAIESSQGEMGEAWRDVAADVAVQAGDRERAGRLLADSGRESHRRGALATAIAAFSRALEMLRDPDQRAGANAALVEALALSGRVDEAMRHGRALIAELGEGGAPAHHRAEVHTRLAHAAVDATRWSEAVVQIDAAKGLLASQPSPSIAASVAVLEAEVALARDELDRARALADSALDATESSAEVRCHAFELVGRSERLRDLDTARRAFEQAISTAETAKLPIWRLRALHELGTIELFEYGGADTLREARDIAEDVGALSMAAVLDVQLAATASLRFAIEDMTAHAHAAVDITERLGLGHLNATALDFLAESHGLRRDTVAMERCLARASAASPDNPEVDVMAWACRGWVGLLIDDQAGALDALERAVAIARDLPQAPPGMFRGLWPVLLAASGDARARSAIEEVRDGPAGRPFWNRGLINYAQAILAGRAGEPERASTLARSADVELAVAPVWAGLGRLHSAPAAFADGWGQPRDWLESVRATFASHGLDVLAQRCTALLGAEDDRFARFGITTREAEVLELVAEGLANKEIAVRLRVSPRTVEKHVESLLRKTDARSRTHLLAVVGGSGTDHR